MQIVTTSTKFNIKPIHQHFLNAKDKIIIILILFNSNTKHVRKSVQTWIVNKNKSINQT